MVPVNSRESVDENFRVCLVIIGSKDDGYSLVSFYSKTAAPI
ncbi:MAG TPA: hypothetical protein VD815_05150 [Candidatus Saccharimonadales bacterium]|nr:hypothetical protein [Candidatus Saccharimonadales bacterium]